MEFTSRAADLIPWLAGACSFILVWVTVISAVHWVREFRAKPDPSRYRRGGAVPPGAIEELDDGPGGVR